MVVVTYVHTQFWSLRVSIVTEFIDFYQPLLFENMVVKVLITLKEVVIENQPGEAHTCITCKFQ